MRKRQIRRERPTLKTAHDYFKEGSFLVHPQLHSLQGAEREAELQKVRDGLEEIVKREFPRTQNLEYAILKSHLIVEYALVQYIRCFAATFVNAKDLRFTFFQKLEIAYLMGFGANDPTLLPTVETLNKVRNQVAHTFALDRNAVDELLRINHEDYNAFKPKNDRQRVQCLRWICAYVCGRTAGELLAAYAIATMSDPEPESAAG
jgi:uncharacterized protein YutE (UPF0331/DUF86 family)